MMDYAIFAQEYLSYINHGLCEDVSFELFQFTEVATTFISGEVRSRVDRENLKHIELQIGKILSILSFNPIHLYVYKECTHDKL